MSYTARARPWGWMASALLLSGCAIFGGKSQSSPVLSEEPGLAAADESLEYEARLHETIRSRIRAAGRRQENANTRVVFKKPYYFRVYSVYPVADDDYSLEFTEKESRTTPLNAEMIVDKIRFATRMHRKREDARNDKNFLRDTGTETTSYELRNGRWRRLGSLFVAEKTEELVGGEWQPIRETAAFYEAGRSGPALEVEEPKRGWRRLMFWR